MYELKTECGSAEKTCRSRVQTAEASPDLNEHLVKNADSPPLVLYSAQYAYTVKDPGPR